MKLSKQLKEFTSSHSDGTNKITGALNGRNRLQTEGQ